MRLGTQTALRGVFKPWGVFPPEGVRSAPPPHGSERLEGGASAGGRLAKPWFATFSPSGGRARSVQAANPQRRLPAPRRGPAHERRRRRRPQRDDGKTAPFDRHRGAAAATLNSSPPLQPGRLNAKRKRPKDGGKQGRVALTRTACPARTLRRREFLYTTAYVENWECCRAKGDGGVGTGGWAGEDGRRDSGKPSQVTNPRPRSRCIQ